MTITQKYLIAAAVLVCAAVAVAVMFWSPRTLTFHTEEPPEIPTLLKIGFVGDWEHGHRKRMKHKLTGQSIAELQKAVDFLNNEFRPDLVIGGGDYVESSSVKKEKAKQQLRDADAVFKMLTAERLYALGNHDMRSLTKAEVREILQMPDNHAVKDIGDWRVIVLDANFNAADDSERAEKNYVLGHVSPAELEWLRAGLDTDRPVIVFVHHSPMDFLNKKNERMVVNISNGAVVRAVLEERGNVAAVISGHSPLSYHEKHNGINYVIVDTLVNEPALGSFATIEFDHYRKGDKAVIRLEQKGINPQRYELVWHRGDKSSEAAYRSFGTLVEEPGSTAPGEAVEVSGDED